MTDATLCPLCHTVATTSTEATVVAGAGWRCVRCGQSWDGARLATVAAYQRYVESRPAVV